MTLLDQPGPDRSARAAQVDACTSRPPHAAPLDVLNALTDGLSNAEIADHPVPTILAQRAAAPRVTTISMR